MNNTYSVLSSLVWITFSKSSLNCLQGARNKSGETNLHSSRYLDFFCVPYSFAFHLGVIFYVFLLRFIVSEYCFFPCPLLHLRILSYSAFTAPTAFSSSAGRKWRAAALTQTYESKLLPVKIIDDQRWFAAKNCPSAVQGSASLGLRSRRCECFCLNDGWLRTYVRVVKWPFTGLKAIVSLLSQRIHICYFLSRYILNWKYCFSRVLVL